MGGRKVLIYNTNAGGGFPIHGAVWDRDLEQWLVFVWDANGINSFNQKSNNFDLNLTYWKDQIPWNVINPQILTIKKTACQYDIWMGFDVIPTFGDGRIEFPISATYWSLEGLYILNAPEWGIDYPDIPIAIRPGYGGDNTRS